MKTVNCRAPEKALSGGKLVCGEHIATKPQGRRSPRAGKPGRAYCSVSSWPGAKYPESSLETVVPQLLGQAKSPVTTLVIQSPSSDITNLQEMPDGRHKDLVIQSAENVVSTVERALAANPSLRKAVILEQLPRKDSIHLFSLTHVYNTTLQELAAASRHNSRLVVVGHLVRVHNGLSDLGSSVQYETTTFMGSGLNFIN